VNETTAEGTLALKRAKRARKRMIRDELVLRESIVGAHQEGASLREIGEAVGYSPEGVRRIIRREQ
jgi:hypothetical protein